MHLSASGPPAPLTDSEVTLIARPQAALAAWRPGPFKPKPARLRGRACRGRARARGSVRLRYVTTRMPKDRDLLVTVPELGLERMARGFAGAAAAQALQ